LKIDKHTWSLVETLLPGDMGGKSGILKSLILDILIYP